jgi:hypothetical protein
MAFISLALGVLGLATAAVPLYGFMMSFPLAIAGVVPGVLVLRNSKRRRQVATAGVILCGLGILAAIFNLLLSAAAVPFFF